MPKPANWQRQLLDQLEGGIDGKMGERIEVPASGWADALTTVCVYAEADRLSCDYDTRKDPTEVRCTITGEGHDESLGDCDVVVAQFTLVLVEEAPHA